MRKWAYETFGSERAIEFVVMATPEDLRVNADYIRMAEPGGPMKTILCLDAASDSGRRGFSEA